MGAAGSTENEVWPSDWEALPEDKRKLARAAILSLSALPPEEFLDIGSASHAVKPDAWKFGDYHAAAAAAVQEDIKLNKIIYKLVPRKIDESTFWRLYFSQVLYVLDSVKTHGQYPPPPVRARPRPTPIPRARRAQRSAYRFIARVRSRCLSLCLPHTNRALAYRVRVVCAAAAAATVQEGRGRGVQGWTTSQNFAPGSRRRIQLCRHVSGQAPRACALDVYL